MLKDSNIRIERVRPRSPFYIIPLAEMGNINITLAGGTGNGKSAFGNFAVKELGGEPRDADQRQLPPLANK